MTADTKRETRHEPQETGVPQGDRAIDEYALVTNAAPVVGDGVWSLSRVVQGDLKYSPEPGSFNEMG
jgi:hypothetical protein